MMKMVVEQMVLSDPHCGIYTKIQEGSHTIDATPSLPPTNLHKLASQSSARAPYATTEPMRESQ